jgi:hypothetical protein
MMPIVCDLRPVLSSVALAALLALITATVVSMTPRVSNAENPADAVARIHRGPHVQMPPPQTAYASGQAGKGMTIENGTGYLLRVHFSGSMNRTVDVPNGQSVGVELVVGSYEVAAEVPGTSIMPFYGTQTYQLNTHYRLKFFVERRF